MMMMLLITLTIMLMMMIMIIISLQTLASHPMVFAEEEQLHKLTQLAPKVLAGHGKLQDGPKTPGGHSQYPKRRLQWPL